MTKCRTAYQDPTVAYNTGYNDGQREERVALLKALAAFEISVLSDGDCRTMPQVCGRLKKLCREVERGVHRADEARADATCGVCGQSFRECEYATESACAGARARETLRPLAKDEHER